MTDLTTSLLETIRQSEQGTVEKQQKIRSTTQRIQELKDELSAIEIEANNLNREIVVSKQKVISKKHQSECIKLHMESRIQQQETLNTQIKYVLKNQKDKAMDVSNIVDDICRNTRNFTESFGIAANPVVISERRTRMKETLVEELQELEKLFVEIQGLETSIGSLKVVTNDLKEASNRLMGIKELRDRLKTESLTLMEKIESLNLERKDSSKCEAAMEVKQLREEIIQLEMETNKRFLSDLNMEFWVKDELMEHPGDFSEDYNTPDHETASKHEEV